MSNSHNEHETGKRIVRFLSRTVDNVVLVILVLLIIIAGYAYYDTNQVFDAASADEFETYKPNVPEVASFEQLQAINPDVIGWLTVYGTGIDYPLVHSDESNEEYLSRNAKGEVETSGSLFLDYRASKDFSDFNTVIYGHHMENSVMFGDLDKFMDADYFEEHEYGNLYHDGKDYGLQFYAILEVDAYDDTLYMPGISSTTAKEDIIEYIEKNETQIRSDMEVTAEDHLVVLSTCASNQTNGRYVLIGKILDYTVDDPFPEEEKNTGTGIDASSILNVLASKPIWFWLLILLVLVIIIYFIEERIENKRNRKGENEDDQIDS